jgi:D-amino peptidase
MLRVLIAADMEGISGVVNWGQVTAGNAEYERFRRIMTADVNAAVKGAIQAGAEDVIVTDGHDQTNNIILEDLDPRVRLNAGSPNALSMVQGVDNSVNAAMLVGYHARAGTTNAVLDHTWSSKILNVWLNGRVHGEIGINAAMCGYYNVPVVMVTGDQAATSEAIDLLPQVEVAAVKQGRGRYAAECLPLEVAHLRIREAAARAISRMRIDTGLQAPYKLEAPILVTVEFHLTIMADRVAILPGVDRLDGRRIQYTADDMLMAYRFFRSAVSLAGE